MTDRGVTRYMRSGSPAPDGSGWPSAQHPSWGDEATSGPGPYGAGRRGDPHEGTGGRREMPFGPAISWPNGFRQIDSDSRRLLESGYDPASHGADNYGSGGYGSGGYGSGGYAVPGSERPGSERGAYDRVDPGYGGTPGYGHGPGYRQPAMDDYGYGDPGYSDPSYEGPRTPYGNPALPADHGNGRGNAGASRDFGGTGYRSPGGVPGYQVPAVRDPSPSAHQGSGYQASGYAAPGRQPQPF